MLNDLEQSGNDALCRRADARQGIGAGQPLRYRQRTIANHIRKYFRTRTVVAAIDPDQLAQEDSVLSKLWDRDHDEFLAARALRVAEVDFAPATWAAFRRQVFDGCKPAEVAAELGLTLNAVLLAKSRVLKRLREELRGLVE